LPQFDYLNYGSWALDGIGRITFTPAIPQQLTGYKAELYSYNADGYLVEVREAQSSYDYLTGQIIAPNLATALTRSLTSYDPMGRVTGMVEYAASGTTIAGQAQFERYAIVHDLRGQVISEKGRTRLAKQNGQFDTLYTHTVNNYSATGLGANSPAITSAGQVGQSTGSILYFSETKNWLNGPASPFYGAVNNNGAGRPDFDYADAYTRYSYRFYEAEVQLQVKLINRDAPAGVDSNFTYDGLGRLSQVSVGGPRSHVLNYVNDINGQVISRTLTRTASGIPGSANPVQYYHYYNGIMLGSNGNNGNDRPDMQTALNERIAQGPTTPGVFRNGGTGPNPYADFDQAYDAVSPETLGQNPSAYTVRSGDSLESIAAQIWGDASLWYMIAEANPSAARGNLNAGTSLIIPNKVANFHNTSDTFRPYDAEKAIGDTQPGTPKPPKAKGCGVVGFILLAVIAIAVAVATSGAAIAAITGQGFASGVSTVIGSSVLGGSVLSASAVGFSAAGFAATVVTAGAIGGAVGSIASQGVGIALGMQDRINWKGVALGAIGGAIGGGLGPGGIAGKAAAFSGAGAVVGGVIRGALSSVLTQGIGVATGLQDKFNWTGVAAGAAGGAVSGWLGGEIAGQFGSKFLERVIAGTAGALVEAAATSLIDGTDFGDNVIAALPNAIANVLSGVITDELTSQESARVERREQAAAVAELESREQFQGMEPEALQVTARALRETAKAHDVPIADIFDDERFSQLSTNLQTFGEISNRPAPVLDELSPVEADSAAAEFNGVATAAGLNLLRDNFRVDQRFGAGTVDSIEAAITSSGFEPLAVGGDYDWGGTISVTARARSFAGPFLTNTLGRLGRFVRENQNSAWFRYGLLALGAVAAPVATLAITAIGATGAGARAISAISRAVIGLAAQAAQALGVRGNRAEDVAIGGLTAISVPLLGAGAARNIIRFAGFARSAAASPRAAAAAAAVSQQFNRARFAVTRRVRGPDMTGARAEALVLSLLRGRGSNNPVAGARVYQPRLPGNQGFDNVAVRYGTDGRPVAITVVEVKNGSTALGQTRAGTQMSPGWIQSTIARMAGSRNPELVRLAGEMTRFQTSGGRIGREIARVQPNGQVNWVSQSRMPRR
jgi:LysM domain